MNRSILAVDDESSVLLLISRVLEQAGYEVRTAGSGEAALQMMIERPADLAIVDKNLPKMSGLALIGKMRERNPNLPVILITAAPQHFTQSPHERIDGYLAKPFKSLDVLREEVAEAFERSQIARERQELQRRLGEVVAQLGSRRP